MMSLPSAFLCLSIQFRVSNPNSNIVTSHTSRVSSLWYDCSLQNRRDFCVFQAIGGKREASADCESRMTGPLFVLF